MGSAGLFFVDGRNGKNRSSRRSVLFFGLTMGFCGGYNLCESFNAVNLITHTEVVLGFRTDCGTADCVSPFASGLA
jgi:hypothetical protein